MKTHNFYKDQFAPADFTMPVMQISVELRDLVQYSTEKGCRINRNALITDIYKNMRLATAIGNNAIKKAMGDI